MHGVPKNDSGPRLVLLIRMVPKLQTGENLCSNAPVCHTGVNIKEAKDWQRGGRAIARIVNARLLSMQTAEKTKNPL